jgi:hypothetical protein
VELGAFVGRQARRRRFLDELLVAPLDGAVPLPERDHGAVGVAKELHLDVARRSYLALQVDRAVTERRHGLRRTRSERRRQLLRFRHAPHATTAAAGRRLDEQRESDVLRRRDDRGRVVRPLDRCRVERPGDDRDTGGLGRPPRDQLVAERLDRVGPRADEGESRIDHRAGERGAFRQEAVARVDRFRPGSQRGLDDRVAPKVALPRRRRPEPDGCVGNGDMEGVDVGVGIDSDGLDPEIAARSHDSYRDLTAVRDEDARERSAIVFAQRHGIRGRPRGSGHNGMLPCFLGGFVSRLSASISRAEMSRGRVSDGRMTSST